MPVPNKEEIQRIENLLTQVKRFLKYASKGTSIPALRQEALEFDGRLVSMEHVRPSEVRKLRGKLKGIYVETAT
jgi:hypothetical protein